MRHLRTDIRGKIFTDATFADTGFAERQLRTRKLPCRVVAVIGRADRQERADEDAVHQRERKSECRVLGQQAAGDRTAVHLDTDRSAAPMPALARQPAMQRDARAGEHRTEQIFRPIQRHDRARRPPQPVHAVQRNGVDQQREQQADPAHDRPR